MSRARSACNFSKVASDRTAQLHKDARSSCVLVVEDERVVGIFTERDVVRLTCQTQSSSSQRVGDVMSSPVLTLPEAEFSNIFYIASLFQQHKIRHLPLLDNSGRLSGLVVHENLRQILRPIDLLKLRSIAEVMTRKVVCASLQSSMQAIAQKMSDFKVSSVVVVDSPEFSASIRPKPLGIVTERDLVQFQALGLNLNQCSVDRVMSSPVFTLGPNETLLTAQQCMDRHFIHRLAVTGEQGELLGIVTQTSLLQAINPLELYNMAEMLGVKVRTLESEKKALEQTRSAELERQVDDRTAALKEKAEREALLRNLATKIRSSLNLQSILETTVEQIRQVLGCDRVSIWQFEEDWQTVAVAESTTRPTSLMGMRVNDTCMNQKHVEIFRQGHLRVLSDIDTANLSNCHRDLLIRLETRAKILVPLLCGDRLWGLLKASESQEPRHWTYEEVELMQALSVQLAIALQQATTHEQLQAELQDRKQTEAALKASDARWQFALEGAGDGVWDWNMLTNKVFYSNQWKTMLGFTTDEIGQGLDEWDTRIHPKDKQQCYRDLNNHLNGSSPFFQNEYRLKCKDGSYKWVLDRGKVIERDKEGRPTRAIGTHADITERKQAEVALQMSEARFRAIFESTAMGIAIVHAPGYKLSLTNPAFQELLEYSSDGLAKLSISDLTMTKDLFAERDLLVECYRGERNCYQIEKRLIRRDGTVIWGNLVTSYIRGPDGNIQFGIITVEDITERKRAVDLELSRNRELREAIFAESTDALFLVDASSWKVFDCNQRAVDLFNAGNKENLLATHHHLYEQHPLLKTEAETIRTVLDEEGVWRRELEYADFQGQSFWGWLSAKQLNVADSAMYLLQIADISIRKQVEIDMSRNLEELKRLNTIKDDFVSTVSHELRTPLTAIDMATRMLRIVLETQEFVEIDEIPVAAKVNKYLDILQEQCKEERELIADLLDLQRLNTSAYELDLSEINLQAWLPEISAGLKERALQQGQQFDIDVDPAVPPFVSDEMVLRRIVSELLNNACKYTPPGERILLKVRYLPLADNAPISSPFQNDAMNWQIELCVANTGVEIPPEERERVFLPFYRAVKGDRWSKRGTGLGLNMVHKFVSLLNGSIELEGETNMTCFKIELPPMGCMVDRPPLLAQVQ